MDELKCPHCGVMVEQVDLDWNSLSSQRFITYECDSCYKDYELWLDCNLKINDVGKTPEM